METKTGTIRFIETKRAKNGSPMFTYEMDDGKKYNSFDLELSKKVKVGDNVEIEGEQEGQYWNMKNMTVIHGNVEKIAENETKKAISYNSDRDKSIISQTLTKCFAEFVAANPSANIEAARQNILDSYKYFLTNL